MENYLGRPVGTFRVDQQTGYLCKKVKNYLKEKGILSQETCTDSHQQNGTSENANKIIAERIRPILIQSGLDFIFWGEAVKNIVSTLNISPQSALDQKVPHEVWTDSKPDISHLRMFGETAFPIIMPSHRISKLHPRSTKTIFMGYDKTKKSCRCYDSDSGKIILSPSCKFLKTMKWEEIKPNSFWDTCDNQIRPFIDPDFVPNPITNLPASQPPPSATRKSTRLNKKILSISKVLLSLDPPKSYGEIKGRPDAQE